MTRPNSSLLTPSGRLRSIDFLRGCAATSVVLLHVALSGVVPNPPWWSRALNGLLLQGWWGVPLFFVISGFCIHLRWAKQWAARHTDRLDFLEFWKRRVHRLYPPYLAVLCLSMLMVYGAYRMGLQTPLVAKYPAPQGRWMLYDFFLHVTMLHGLSPSFDTAGGNNVLWSLAREEYFYLLYFPLMFCRRRWGVLVSTLLVLLVGVISNGAFAWNEQWSQFVARSAPVLWFQWVLGMVAVEAYYGIVKLPRWCSSGYLAMLWFAAAVLAREYLLVAAPFLGGMAFFTLLNFCVTREAAGHWPRLSIVSWLTKVGVFSYSLYLVHNPIRAVLKQLLRRYAESPNPLMFWAVGAVFAFGGYWGARLFFWAVESRFLNSSRENVKKGADEKDGTRKAAALRSIDLTARPGLPISKTESPDGGAI